mmetsp:Transcript_470/g.549  ORF Transcript_470/g.549 Transcript_470/m.549 type:complete len:411 (-) Transcript_470:386-1618(-)
MQSVKVVVVGDGAVGKSCLCVSFAYKAFPRDYVPTVFDNFNAVVKFENRSVNLGLWDTAGQHDFERIRPVSYKETDVVFMFFSLVNPISFQNIKAKWLPEIRQHVGDAPVLLVGTKLDLRTDQETLDKLRERNQKPIERKAGKKMARDIGAVGYFECSSKENLGLKDLFDEAVRIVINKKQNKKYGKVCASTSCRQVFTKLGPKRAVKCSRCSHLFCHNCTQSWSDGFKGCLECSANEARERKQAGETLPKVKREVTTDFESGFGGYFDPEKPEKKPKKKRRMTKGGNLIDPHSEVTEEEGDKTADDAKTEASMESKDNNNAELKSGKGSPKTAPVGKTEEKKSKKSKASKSARSKSVSEPTGGKESVKSPKLSRDKESGSVHENGGSTARDNDEVASRTSESQGQPPAW